MIRRMATVVALASVIVGAVALSAQGLPATLERMADTERAFARKAAESTIREAFIEFFADEAVSFEPEPGPARERLRANDRPQPAGFQLQWEPRLGDVAASGDLGFLTGPARYINPGQPDRFTNYFSVWKRQANGDYRVILDLGTPTPEAVPYAPGVTRSAATASWTGAPDREAAARSLKAADEACARAAERSLEEAYRAALHPQGRLYRAGTLPLTSRDAALAWLRTSVTAMTFSPEKVEVAASADLGYTWGAYTVKAASGPSGRGYYVRVWTRQADGGWQIAADVTTNVRP